ncbi:MAG: DNA mismatch repair protein MutS [Oscillospiraceae bacterium]|jgi:DNA mismatch repair protein MutS|nr:DNA mismatch repair protein MutS [Oscillospiraceae bacterium]
MAYTPMMEQYFKIKEKHPDALLFYRLGDFYEMFFEDAVMASRELELVLTGRDCGQEERAPMCGVPYHSADNYIAKLVSKGYKVAICEQTEDPALAKGLVNRDVVRILTPGTVIENSMLDESKNNYLACAVLQNGAAGLCFCDVSTGALQSAYFTGATAADKSVNEIGHFSPSEIILNPEAAQNKIIRDFLYKQTSVTVETPGGDFFDHDICENIIKSHFALSSLADAGLDGKPLAVCAVGAVLQYLQKTQMNSLDNITKIDLINEAKYMSLDITARRNLELVESSRRREKKGSLLWVLDHTKTAMGKRMLRTWVEMPLVSVAHITARQNAVGELFEQTNLRHDLVETLSGINDMERILTRIVFGSANAKELRSLSQTIERIPALKALLSSCRSQLLCETAGGMDLCEDIRALIETAITEDPPHTVREGGMIRTGFNDELDALHDIVTGGKDFLRKIEEQEQEKTGIKKLKIGYNRVFGYYIEVLNSYRELVPEHYIRKQTLSNCERYITQELKELESKVLGAQERIVKLEYELFCTVRDTVADAQYRIKRTAEAVAAADTLCSLAHAAVVNNYTCPHVNNSDLLHIADGRHPVVEKFLDGAPFVPNDAHLDCEKNRTAIITGPNMAGKSTYMRQVALIAVMAQIGSFVPARSAEIGIVDNIFTRIGASDDLAAGQSTFMTEMVEVASILANATKKSLIILDEIGRGTSTFDGMSIARAVLEYVSDRKRLGAKTLFATHYHELTVLEEELDGIKNYNIAVKKRGDDIIFLRRIVKGGADESYGIEVAALAGVPKQVVARAKGILKTLEEKEHGPKTQKAEPILFAEEAEVQLSFASGINTEISEELRALDVNTLTPIEALQYLYDLKSRIQ